MTGKPKWPEDPYILATSNSWRRFLTESGESVCEPTAHPRDRHPDLVLAPGVGDLFREAPNLYRELEDAAAELENTAHCTRRHYPANSERLASRAARYRRVLAKARGETA